VGKAERSGVEECAAAEIVHQWHPIVRREVGEFAERGGLDETLHAEVRGVDAQYQLRRPGAEYLLEIRSSGLVGGSDFDQTRSRTFDDLGDPDPAADLDKLAASYGHAATTTTQADRERKGSRVVITGERTFRARKLSQILLRDRQPTGAPAGPSIKLQQKISAGRIHRGCDGSLAPRGTSEVGVDNDAGGVDRRWQG
jgi:hypothetical protein